MVVLLHYRSGLTLWDIARYTSCLGSFRKDAQAPISRDKQEVTTEVGDKKTYRAAPPLARPLYRPAPPQPKTTNNDFDDLPGEEIVIPSKTTPPAMKPSRQRRSVKR